MCGKERKNSRSQFVDSGYYIRYGAEDKLERNYTPQPGAVVGPQYGTGEDYYTHQPGAVVGPQYGTGEDYYTPQPGVVSWPPVWHW